MWNEQLIISLIKRDYSNRTSDIYFPVLRWSDNSLMQYAALGSLKASSLENPKCMDLDQNYRSKFALAPLRSLMNMPDLSPPCRSKEWADACLRSDQWGETARLICPRTCNCTRPSSTQVYMDYGCPTECFYEASYLKEIRKRPCHDVPKAEAIASPEWRMVVSILNVTWQRVMGRYQDKFRPPAEYVAKHGCEGIAFVREQQGISLCERSLVFPGRINMQFWCPVTCKCFSATNLTYDKNTMPGCPISCQQPVSLAMHTH